MRKEKDTKWYDFTIAGYVVANQFLVVDEIPELGRTVWVKNPDYSRIYFGGPAMNITYCLGKLGSRVLPVMSHVNDEKKGELVSLLTSVGASVEALEDPVPGSAGVGLMVQDRHGNHIAFACRNEEGMKSGPPRAMEESYFTKCSWAILTVSQAHNARAFLEGVKRYHTPLVFSMKIDEKCFPEQILREILWEAEIIFMNEVECRYLEELFGFRDIRVLFEDGNADVIVVTRGERGSTVYHRDHRGALRCEEIPVTACEKMVDATGAGDAYVAGFMYGLNMGEDMVTCGQYGSTLASFIFEKMGSMTNAPTLEMLLERNSRRPDVRGGKKAYESD